MSAPSSRSVHTDEVLDAIDQAVEDWEISGDAMRWRPEVPDDLPPPRVYMVQQDRVYVAPLGAGWEQLRGVNQDDLQLVTRNDLEVTAFTVYRQRWAPMPDGWGVDPMPPMEPEEVPSGTVLPPRNKRPRPERPSWQSPYGPAARRRRR